MTATPAKASDAETDAPLDTFTNCHVGILDHLQDLGRLPSLLEPAAQARKIAADTVKFFREAVYEHHAEEERVLFPAVLASAVEGDEHGEIRAMVDHLVDEHRQIEGEYLKLEPELKAIARGHDASLDVAVLAALVGRYAAHARFEEEQFLPRSQTILGRTSNDMAALGMSLHLRHALPELRKRFGHLI